MDASFIFLAAIIAAPIMAAMSGKKNWFEFAAAGAVLLLVGVYWAHDGFQSSGEYEFTPWMRYPVLDALGLD